MKKLYLHICFVMLTISVASAQFYTGGNVSVNFDNIFYIDAAPLLGYKYKRLDLGVSPVFSYQAVQPPVYAYGGRVHTQFTIIKDVFLQVGFEMNNYEIVADGVKRREWQISAPVGGGYRYKISEKTMAHGTILYDPLLPSSSPQKNPIIRGGIIHSF